MGQAWGIPAVPGERSVANADEDSLTMAVTASQECLVGQDPANIDAVYFATTTSPYTEKQCASIIAAALDLRKDVFTADFTDSLRSGTAAIRAARDAIESGSARSVLVVAADCRPAEPETMWEQLLGDGAGALLLSKDGGATIRAAKSVTSEMLGQWRRSGDRYVRAFEPKLETEYATCAASLRRARPRCRRQESSLRTWRRPSSPPATPAATRPPPAPWASR
jgi:3-hydroxy-3-methylglutaryl CoA synthase